MRARLRVQATKNTLVQVTVMNVWVVRMAVRQHVMPVSVLMRLSAVPVWAMVTLVVLVMRMAVHVLERLVRVHVLMPL